MAALATARTAPASLAAAVQSRQTGSSEAGMTTAEYAVGTVAACGFAGVLYKVITSPIVIDLLKAVISKAFSLSF
jgi:hypothetical protein